MKKYIFPSVALLTMAAHGLFAQDNISFYKHSNIPLVKMPEKSQFRAASVDVAPIRMITEEEFKGEKPISLYLNQQLIIPVHYSPGYLDNNLHKIGAYPSNEEILEVTTENFTAQNFIFDFNIVCTGLVEGNSKVIFDYDDKSIKEWNINVINPFN